jgi:hypothetical protein
MDGYDLCTGTIQTLLAGGQFLGLGAHFGKGAWKRVGVFRVYA